MKHFKTIYVVTNNIYQKIKGSELDNILNAIYANSEYDTTYESYEDAFIALGSYKKDNPKLKFFISKVNLEIETIYETSALELNKGE